MLTFNFENLSNTSQKLKDTQNPANTATAHLVHKHPKDPFRAPSKPRGSGEIP